MNLRNALVILFACALLESCSRVRIKDGEWCGDAGSDGASCFHTLSDETRDIPLGQWNDERFGMLCTKPDNFAEWKKAILKLCYLSKACTYDFKKKVVRFHDRVENFVMIQIPESKHVEAQYQN